MSAPVWDCYAPDAGEGFAEGKVVVEGLPYPLLPSEARDFAHMLLACAEHAEGVARELDGEPYPGFERRVDQRRCLEVGEHLGSALHSRSECDAEAGA